MTLLEVRAMTKKAKYLYVYNPITEGYVRIYKNDLLTDLNDLSDETETDIHIRINQDVMYIN